MQLVRRSTRQNTQLNVQGTMEEEFQSIVSVAKQQVLHDIDNTIVDELLEDSDVADTGTQVSISSSEADTSSSNLSPPEAPANTPDLTSTSEST